MSRPSGPDIFFTPLGSQKIRFPFLSFWFLFLLLSFLGFSSFGFYILSFWSVLFLSFSLYFLSPLLIVRVTTAQGHQTCWIKATSTNINRSGFHHWQLIHCMWICHIRLLWQSWCSAEWKASSKGQYSFTLHLLWISKQPVSGVCSLLISIQPLYERQKL